MEELARIRKASVAYAIMRRDADWCGTARRFCREWDRLTALALDSEEAYPYFLAFAVEMIVAVMTFDRARTVLTQAKLGVPVADLLG